MHGNVGGGTPSTLIFVFEIIVFSGLSMEAQNEILNGWQNQFNVRVLH